MAVLQEGWNLAEEGMITWVGRLRINREGLRGEAMRSGISDKVIQKNGAMQKTGRNHASLKRNAEA